MHPALSVIFFTTASGFGYGLAFWLTALRAGGAAEGGWYGAIGLGLALAAISAGLLSSTFHLGRPERAWRAFSQWRSSWLSREGVAAVVSVAVLGLCWLGWIAGAAGSAWSALAVLAALTAIATVYCTGMIYQSLKPIAAWRSALTTPVYLLYAGLTGGYGGAALAVWFGEPATVMAVAAILLTAATAAAKLAYWARAKDAMALTPEAATGLGDIGQVRQLEAPHVTQNYITREMGFRIARKHAEKLRRIVLALGLAGPAALTIIGLLAVDSAAFLFPVAAILAITGAFVERWLFFAEAKHAVMAFYGER